MLAGIANYTYIASLRYRAGHWQIFSDWSPWILRLLIDRYVMFRYRGNIQSCPRTWVKVALELDDTFVINSFLVFLKILSDFYYWCTIYTVIIICKGIIFGICLLFSLRLCVYIKMIDGYFYICVVLINLALKYDICMISHSYDDRVLLRVQHSLTCVKLTNRICNS
jgi:hypothetical protein